MKHRLINQDQFITTAVGVNLRYIEVGSGDCTLLLVPGWTMSAEVFEHQLEHYENSSTFRCIAFDPRSHGRSSKPSSGHTYADHGQDIAAFIQALNLDNIVLAGWSFGTLAALAYVNQSGSEKLSGLIMLDGPPRALGADNQTDWVTYRHDDADGLQAFYTYHRLTNPESTNSSFVEWLLTDPTEAAKAWLLDMTRQTPDEHASFLNATANFLDFRADLIALNKILPLMYVVRAEQEKVVSQWAKNNTPLARIKAFGGHMMFWEEPDRFNRLLDEYLMQI